MKKIIVLALMLLSINAAAASKNYEISSGQAMKPKPSFQLTGNPAALLFGALSGNFSYAISDKAALMIPVAFQFLPFSLYGEFNGRSFRTNANLFAISAGIGVKFFL